MIPFGRFRYQKQTHTHMNPFTMMSPMSEIARRTALFIAMVGLIAALAACGGGSKSTASSSGSGDSSLTGEVVAKVGDSVITKAEVNHWMTSLGGEDYYELSRRHTVPLGLVSDPPNYAACVANLEAAMGSTPPKGGSLPSAAQLLTKCRELNQAVKAQAVTFLVGNQWQINLDRELGLTASEAEVTRLFNKIKAERFPTAAALNAYLRPQRWTLADERLSVELDVLGQKYQHEIETGGKQAYAKFLLAAQRWTAKTDCRPGYVVSPCKQYKEPKTPPTKSPAVLMEQVASIIIDRCTDRAACG